MKCLCIYLFSVVVGMLCSLPVQAITRSQTAAINQVVADIKQNRLTDDQALKAIKQVTKGLDANVPVVENLYTVAEQKGIDLNKAGIMHTPSSTSKSKRTASASKKPTKPVSDEPFLGSAVFEPDSLVEEIPINTDFCSTGLKNEQKKDIHNRIKEYDYELLTLYANVEELKTRPTIQPSEIYSLQETFSKLRDNHICEIQYGSYDNIKLYSQLAEQKQPRGDYIPHFEPIKQRAGTSLGRSDVYKKVKQGLDELKEKIEQPKTGGGYSLYTSTTSTCTKGDKELIDKADNVLINLLGRAETLLQQLNFNHKSVEWQKWTKDWAVEVAAVSVCGSGYGVYCMGNGADDIIYMRDHLPITRRQMYQWVQSIQWSSLEQFKSIEIYPDNKPYWYSRALIEALISRVNRDEIPIQQSQLIPLKKIFLNQVKNAFNMTGMDQQVLEEIIKMIAALEKKPILEEKPIKLYTSSDEPFF